MRLEIKSYAKINLTLEVLFRRDDGYHQVQTILQEIQLHDTIYLEEIAGESIDFVCWDSSLPQGEENLAYRAAQLLKEAFNPGRGVRMELIKRIPVAAGLGGGSSNAAAVLKGLNRLWGLSLKDETLRELGAGLGSDVPFFLCGGTALGEGRGEVIRPLPDFPRAQVLLAAPLGAALSAGKVYGSLRLDKIPKGLTTAKFVSLLEEGQKSGKDFFNDLVKIIQNHLEPPVFYLEKKVAFIKEKLLQKGLPAMVSGSGPTVFALSREREILDEAATELFTEGCQVILTETISKKRI